MSTGEIISTALAVCTIIISLVAIFISVYQVKKQNKLSLIERRLKVVRKIEVNFDGACILANKLENLEIKELLTDKENNDEKFKKQIQSGTYLILLIGSDSFNKLNLSKNMLSVESISKDYLFLVNEFNISKESFAVFKKKSLKHILQFSYVFFFSLIFVFRDCLISLQVDNEIIEALNFDIKNILKNYNFEKYDFTTESLLEDLKRICLDLSKKHFIESLYKETSVFNNKKRLKI